MERDTPRRNHDRELGRPVLSGLGCVLAVVLVICGLAVVGMFVFMAAVGNSLGSNK
jgi:hypothetical protein